MTDLDLISKNFIKSSELIKELSKEDFTKKIAEVSELICQAYASGNKLLAAGNGGSATDAQHIVSELVNKFYHERKPLNAISLTADTAVLTSCANDYSYDTIFSRQIEAQGKPGDVFIAITTSGNSENIIKAVEKAKSLGVKTIGLLGKDGGKLKGMCDYELIVPDSDVARIQEAHRVIYHTMCELIEKRFLE